MVWANIESACSSAVIEPLQKRYQHEVIAVPKLERANANLHDSDREQKK